jgi:hypothetical protein
MLKSILALSLSSASNTVETVPVAEPTTVERSSPRSVDQRVFQNRIDRIRSHSLQKLHGDEQPALEAHQSDGSFEGSDI